VPETFKEPTNSEAAFRTVIFARGVTRELRFEIAETLREPANSEDTLRTETFAKGVTNEFKF
jgi:hypothetical protein